VTGDFEKDPRAKPLKPLVVSVKTAANLLGVSETTTWGLISSRKIDAIGIGRRTLVTMASLESLVATLASTDREPRKVGKKSSDGGLKKKDRLKMTVDQVRSRISAAGLAIHAERRLPNNAGTQIVTIRGQVVDIYDTGTIVIHGRDAEILRSILIQPSSPKRPNP
jgi:excisionase family DNA binding protein